MEKTWFQKFALVEDSYSKYCGCPYGTSYQKRGQLSNMLHMLSNKENNEIQLPAINVRHHLFNVQKTCWHSIFQFQDSCESYKNVTNLSNNVFVRQKLSKLLEMEQFEINNETLEVIQDYWMEDIVLVQKLLQSDIDESFIGLLDGVGTCVNIFQNPGVTIQEGHFCEVSGFCMVNNVFDELILFN